MVSRLPVPALSGQEAAGPGGPLRPVALPRRLAFIRRPIPGSGSRVAFVVALLVAAGVPALLPAGSAQVPDAISFRLDSLATTHSTVVAQGDNTVWGDIVNDGNVPVQVWAYIGAKYAGITNAGDTRTFTIQPGDSQTVTWVWAGPPLETTAGTVNFTLHGWRQVGDMKDDVTSTSITRPVQLNDFEIRDFWQNPAQGIEQGSDVTLAAFTLTNTGNVRDEPDLDYTATPSQNCNGGSPLDWDIDISLNQQSLGAGESTQVVVHATAPGNEYWVGCSLDLMVRVDSSESRLHAPIRDQTQIPTPTVTDGTSLRVNIDHTSYEDVLLGDSRSYTVTVYNPTEFAEGVQVATDLTDGENQGVAVVVTPSGLIQVLPGQSRAFQVSVQVAQEAFAGTRTWTVTTSDPDAPDDEPYGSHLIQLGVATVFGAELHIMDPDHEFDAEPGIPVSIPILLHNSGNDVDTLCIEAELPNDWSLAASCYALGPSEFLDIDDWEGLTPATWALPGDHSATIRAYSENGTAWFPPGDESITSDDRDLTFMVAPRTHPRLVPTLPPILPVFAQSHPCAFAVHPGEHFTFNLALRNEGNVAGDFLLSVNEVQPGWTVWADTNEEYSLDRLGSNTVQVAVQAPQSFGANDGSFFVLELIDAANGNQFDDMNGCHVFPSVPDLLVAQADPFTTPPDLYANHPATLQFRVSNEGWNATGAPVLVQSVIRGPDGKEFKKQNHTLPALDRWTGHSGQDLDVNFTPTTPGPYTYTVTVDPDDVIEEHDDGDNVVTGAVQVLNFGITVTAPPSREAIPTQHLTFEGTLGNNPAFRVVNAAGAGPHTLNLILEMDPPWKPASHRQVTLAPGEDYWVDWNFTIPATPLVGEVQVTLRAANATLPTLAVEQTTRIRIHDTGAPTIANFTANATAVLSGGNVSFSVDLHDTTGIAEARVIAIGPNGTQSQAMAGDGPVGTFRANLTFDDLGVHTVYVWAMDEAGNAADNADDGTTLEVRVLPTDRPHVQLIAPENGTSLRPGTPVVLSVLSQLPVHEFEYTIAAGATPVKGAMTNPLQLATKDWPEGELTLSVRVKDALGAPGGATFSFLVDGTPPQIDAVSLDPEGAKPGDTVDVKATIQDASPLASVVLRIEGREGRAQDFDMELEGNGAGRWSKTIGLPEDAVRIAIIATDAAGNRAYVERFVGDPQLQDHDGGSRFVSALPLPILALVALAGAFKRSRNK